MGGGNQYGYAGGDPVNYSDPFGLCPNGPKPCGALGNFVAGVVSGAHGPSASVSSAVNKASEGYKWGVAAGTLAYALGAPVIGQAGVELDAALAGGGVAGNRPRNAPGQTAGGRATDEHGNALGPSGRPAIPEVDHSTKKRAKDAARVEGQTAPLKHPSPERGSPPFSSDRS